MALGSCHTRDAEVLLLVLRGCLGSVRKTALLYTPFSTERSTARPCTIHRSVTRDSQAGWLLSTPRTLWFEPQSSCLLVARTMNQRERRKRNGPTASKMPVRTHRGLPSGCRDRASGMNAKRKHVSLALRPCAAFPLVSVSVSFVRFAYVLSWVEILV